MNAEQIIELFEKYEDEYLSRGDLDSLDLFLLGLSIIRETHKNCSLGAEHDVIYVLTSEKVEDSKLQLSETDILELSRLGWHWDEDSDCFAKFV